MRLGTTPIRYLYCGENRQARGTGGNRTLGTQHVARHFFYSHLGSHMSMYCAGNKQMFKNLCQRQIFRFSFSWNV